MFDFIFAIMPILIPLLVIGVFIYAAYSIISQKIKDDRSPIVREQATVVAKRLNVSTDSSLNYDGSSNHHHHRHYTSDTVYYVTFQLASGERKELVVRGDEYGMLVEKDFGYLTHQGSRFKGFEIIS